MSLPFSPHPAPHQSTSTMACLVLQNLFFLTPQESRYLWPAPSVLINTCSKTVRWWRTASMVRWGWTYTKKTHCRTKDKLCFSPRSPQRLQEVPCVITLRLRFYWKEDSSGTKVLCSTTSASFSLFQNGFPSFHRFFFTLLYYTFCTVPPILCVCVCVSVCE